VRVASFQETSWAKAMEADAATTARAAEKNIVSRDLFGDFRDVKIG